MQASGGDAAGGVVDKAEQGEARAPALEPVMAAGIALQHHAEARPSRATGTVLPGAAFLGRRPFGQAKNAAHALAAESETFFLDE